VRSAFWCPNLESRLGCVALGCLDVCTAHMWPEHVESINQHFVAFSWSLSYIISTMHGYMNIIFVIYMLLLPELQTGGAWEPS
jgi:hypothetical protein